jgi:hypothetical protein
MGWMGAIATDIEELVIMVVTNPTEELPDVRSSGWVSPTEAGLVCRLISDSIAGTGQPGGLERAMAILGGTK